MHAHLTQHPPKLHCPNCRYDVTQTLTDNITTCPECGNPISRESCFLTPFEASRTGHFIDSALLFLPTIATVAAVTLTVFANLHPRLIPIAFIGGTVAALLALRLTRGAEHWNPADWFSLALLCLNVILSLGFGCAALVLFTIAQFVLP